MADFTDYIQREFGGLVGKTIAKVRPLLAKELSDLGWDDYRPAFMVIFTDGTVFIPSSQFDGIDSGFLILADLADLAG